MSDSLLIRHSAPTLFGLKAGSLFLCPIEHEDELRRGLRIWNCLLRKKGLFAICVRRYSKKALIYVYRLSRLNRDLSHPLAVHILKGYGYPVGKTRACIGRLIRRLNEQADFPHEIGLFLGYPPRDVQGFIEDKAGTCKCCGWWKVYDNVAAATRLFQAFSSCRHACCELYAKGAPLEELVVAG